MKFLSLIFSVIFLSLSQVNAHKKTIPVDESFFLEIIANAKDCKKATGKSCYFRDHAIDEKPYFHNTKIIIFKSKAIAIQYYNHKAKIIKIKDLHYNLTTTKDNLLAFDTKNGEVFNLELLKGDLDNEKFQESDCAKNKMLYDFYKTYDRESEIITSLGTFEDEYDFTSMSQYKVFAPINDRNNIMTIASKGEEDFEPIKDIYLCKFPHNTKANVRHENHQDCLNKPQKECFDYKECKDFLKVENCKTTLFRGFGY